MSGVSDALAQAIAPDARRADGTPSLHLAIHECSLTTIHDVLADCGDNSPDVLASNIASVLTARIEAVYPVIREGIAAEVLAELEFEIRDAKTLDKTTQAAICAVIRGKVRRALSTAKEATNDE